MDWYYSDDGKQAGPVADEALMDLVRSGKIRPDTIVWHSGLPAWTPYGQIAGAGVASAAVPPLMSSVAAAVEPAPAVDTKFCTECGRSFSVDNLARFGDRWVCGNCKELFAQKLREGVNLQGTANYAGFWIRLGAVLIDGLILAVVFGSLGAALMFAFIVPRIGSNPGSPNELLAAIMPLIGIFELAAIAVASCYEASFIHKWGATLGKKAVGLKVVMPDGGGISLGRAFGRYFAKILSGLPLQLGYIIAAFDSEKRALHDHTAARG